MEEGLSREEKRKLSYQRQNAVRRAWKEEQSRVSNGQGTRKWSLDEQKELLERGAVSGYEGHHMKSVSLYPEYAGDSRNIQFLSEQEHLYGAHNGSYHNLTNGYYDPERQVMNEFGDELEEIPMYELQQSNVDLIDDIRNKYIQDAEAGNMESSKNEIYSAGTKYENDGTGMTDLRENIISMSDGYSEERG